MTPELTKEFAALRELTHKEAAIAFWVSFLCSVVLGIFLVMDHKDVERLDKRMEQVEHSRRVCSQIDVGTATKPDRVWLCRDESDKK